MPPRYGQSVQFGARFAARRGLTLIEMVAVMGANVVLMAAAIAALMAMSRADRNFDGRLAEIRALAPLADRLREDVHAAARVRWNDAEQTLYLNAAAGGPWIAYRGEVDRWERRVADVEDGAADGELSSVYRLPEGHKVNVAVEPAEAATGELVRLRWHIDPEEERPDRELPSAIEMVVTVGRDERLLHE
jgi:hypothetical protein